jgi:hypothetical protein
MVPSKSSATDKQSWLISMAGFAILPVLILVFVQPTIAKHPSHGLLTLALSIVPGVFGLGYGFTKVRPMAENTKPDSSFMAQMKSNSLVALSLCEFGFLGSVFLGGRPLVEITIAIVLFAVAAALCVVPTGLTVYNNFEKTKSE